MIGTFIRKEITTLNNKFTESEVNKENEFSCSHISGFTCIHFNTYECLKWLEKLLWLINTKFCDITDMFKSTEAGVPRWSAIMALLTVSQNYKKACWSLLSKNVIG